MTPLPASRLPVLQTGYCVIADYDQEWLEQVLQDAAEAAGVSLPFQAEIAQAIMIYLESLCPLRSVPLEYLFSRIQAMLEEVGLYRIAAHLRKQTPPVDVDLGQLAQEAPLPLFFYTSLRRRMEELQRLGLTTYHFNGKKQCSMLLGRRRRACPTQRRALRELEAFIRDTPQASACLR